MKLKEANEKTLTGATLVDVVAMLEKVDVALTKTGKEYLNLTFRDKTGTILVKEWDKGEKDKGNYVIYGVYSLDNLSCSIFNNAANYVIKASTRVKLIPEENPSDYCTNFTPETEKLKTIINYYMEQLTGQWKTIATKAFNELLENPDDFYIWPAAESMHHDKAGGLAFHTATMLQLSDAICKVYGKIYPINRQLLLTATMLHDFFKTVEYDLNEDGTGKLTDAALEGGHTILCCDFIHDCEKEGIITREESKMLRHMILSHHGEFGPVQPATIEAMILHYVDMTDSRSYMFIKETLEMEEGEYAAKKSFGIGTRPYKTTLKPE